jgi:hypothetical protein
VSACLSWTASAEITWNWSDAETGLHSGTFTTTGDLINGIAEYGSYTIIDFTLDATTSSVPLGSMSNGDYKTWQPSIGFNWDGSVPTTFWRSSGQYNNGTWITIEPYPAPGATSSIFFDIDTFKILDANYIIDPEVSQSSTISLVPIEPKTAHGTPLSWMSQHDLPSDTTDPDLDGQLSWQEYICGTNPTNSQSFFSANISNSALSWNVVTNRIYSIESTVNLTTGFSQITNRLTEGSFSIPTTNDTMYFRINVQLAE